MEKTNWSIAGSFNKQKNWHTRLVLDDHKMSRFLPTHQNLKSVYRGLNCRYLVHHLDGSNHTLLSQDCVLETGSGCEIGGQNGHSKDKEGGDCPNLARRSTISHILNMTYSNMMFLS